MCSLYIHIPFCDRKCYYCAFAIVVGQNNKALDYIKCLHQEASRYSHMQIGSVYIGGGTPSTLSPLYIKELFKVIQESFVLKADAEITVEVNPEGLSREGLQVWRKCGVNRVSLGVQSLNDKYLKYLGRLHDAQAARGAYHMIREVGFQNVSCDLMISFPQQTDEELHEDQRQMIALNPEHISLYALTIEAPSRFHARNVLLPESDVQARQLEFTVRNMGQAGYDRYEVSNFAREGFASIHNINYWDCGNYIGLGVGAHSHLDGQRFYNKDRFKDYMRSVIGEGQARVQTEKLSSSQRLNEALVFGLRKIMGVNVKVLEERYNCLVDAPRRQLIQEYIEEGLLEFQGPNLCATSRGLMVLDDISSRLF